ncbi:MAG TPA: type II toxin-antitoxin system prevent-host-death family antitoxin [Nitrospiria bacterium]|nr:type II toxin-antitoxin system prevent-host-death family antitoxin [Nitrospiria bacterium]
MIKAGIKEARQHLTEYLAKVERGEEIIITKRSEPIAKIIPLTKRRRVKLVSHKELRGSIVSKGKPMTELIIESRKEEAY